MAQVYKCSQTAFFSEAERKIPNIYQIYYEPTTMLDKLDMFLYSSYNHSMRQLHYSHYFYFYYFFNIKKLSLVK